jgi:hypothetical protein
MTFKGWQAMHKVANMATGCTMVSHDELREMARAAAALKLEPTDARDVLRLTGAPYNDDDVRTLEDLIEQERPL